MIYCIDVIDVIYVHKITDVKDTKKYIIHHD